MRAQFSFAIVIVLVFLGLLTGCGKKLVSVSGRVTLANQSPAKGVVVTFEDPTQHVRASGTTDEDGRYQLSTNALGDGVYLGSYQVSVRQPGPADSSQPEPPRIFHAKYDRGESSGIRFEITAPGSTFDIALEAP